MVSHSGQSTLLVFSSHTLDNLLSFAVILPVSYAQAGLVTQYAWDQGEPTYTYEAYAYGSIKLMQLLNSYGASIVNVKSPKLPNT